MAIGSLVIVVLLHVPYVRMSGVWPFGEHLLFATMADVVMPLLEMLAEFGDGSGAGTKSRRVRLSLAVSPVLADQLADPLVRGGFEDYLVRRIQHAEEDVRGGGEYGERARTCAERARKSLAAFGAMHQRDLLRTIRGFEALGLVEIVSYPATGAILPLLPRPSMRSAQVVQGLRTLNYHLGHTVTGMWLPGGAIAPGAHGESVSDILVGNGLEYALVGEQALGRGARGGGEHSPPGIENRLPLDPQQLPSGLGLLARNDELFTALMDSLWAAGAADRAGEGPDPLVHRGMWADESLRMSTVSLAGADVEITVGPRRTVWQGSRRSTDESPLGAEALGQWAAKLACGLLKGHTAAVSRDGVLVFPVEGRLLGHWTNGTNWLKHFIRASGELDIQLKSAAEAFYGAQPQTLPEVSPSSWVRNGDFLPWQADNTTWYWETVAQTLEHAESLADRYRDATHLVWIRLLTQATREALLLVSGEWAEMLGRGGDTLDYAAERVRSHHDRFRRLAYMLDTANPEEVDVPLLERYELLDNPFGSLDGVLLSADRAVFSTTTDDPPRSWGTMGSGGLV